MQKINQEIAQFSKVLTLYAVRNTYLEDIHSGKNPISNTGDFSDVKIIDATGREITWDEASHISDEQMKVLMKEVVNKVYDIMTNMYNEKFQDRILNYAYSASHHWDDPEIISHIDIL